MSNNRLLHLLAEHVATCRYDDLPKDAVASAKRLLLDTLAVAWAGAAAAGMDRLRGCIVAQSGSACCDLWGVNLKCAALDAAFLNSASAAALEFDSLHVEALIHADIVSTPAVLAAAQTVGASGKSLLAALIVANDVSCRLALAATTHRGWFHTSVYGIFGAAAGCAKVLGLDAAGIANAMGLALSQAAGTQQPLVEQCDATRLQSGFAARAALFSALLASSGATGPRGAIEGAYGLFELYEVGSIRVALRDLGTRYEGSFSSLKKFPTCACNHALTEAALQMVEEFDLYPSQIARSVVRISPFMNRLVASPYAPETDPTVAAQFSAQYSLACVVFRRRVSLADLHPAAALDPQVIDFARRVVVEVDPSNSGRLAPAEVEFLLTDGRLLNRRITGMPGGPASPLSSEAARRKALECIRGNTQLAPDLEPGELVLTVEHVEDLSEVATLFDRCLRRATKSHHAEAGKPRSSA